jgi:hypothetical protein
MENAAKALLIAGGTFIAIITISIVVILFTSVMKITETYNTRIDTNEIAEFNSEITKYVTSNNSDSFINADDVVSIWNKINDWNSSTESEKITITGIIDFNNFDKNEFIINSSINNDYKYKCNIKEYYSETGRIKKIEITQVTS